MRTIDDQGKRRIDVTCATYRESLSAELDGEQPSVETALHLAGCDGCAEFARELPGLSRPLRMRPADEVPDLTERILTAIIGTVPRPSLAVSLSRAALMAVAIAQAVVGVLLLTGGGEHAGPHAAAESGAWNFAIGIALATAALRPRVAYAVLPMVASLVAVLAFASARDLLAGEVTAQRVLSHALIVAGLVLVAALTWQLRRPSRPSRPGRAASNAWSAARPRSDRVSARGLMPR